MVPELKPSQNRPDCGTNKGYQQHKRNNEKACWPCSTANTRYVRAWRVQHDRVKSLLVDVACLRAIVSLSPEGARLLALEFGPEMVDALLDHPMMVVDDVIPESA